MATYQFTARAVDNQGAYSDRTFSIDINNTILDRFIAVGTIGLSRSADGKAWVTEAGMTGIHTSFGNGVWLIAVGGTTAMIRRSTDGVAWSSFVPTINGITLGTTPYFQRVKYRNGKWYGLINHTVASVLQSILVESNDNGSTWTFLGTIIGTTSGFDFDWGNGMFVAGTGSGGIRYSPDGVTWTTTATAVLGLRVEYLNGVWFTKRYFGPLYSSLDGMNWINRFTGVIETMFYHNGYLYRSTETMAVSRSRDAGKTFATFQSLPFRSFEDDHASTVASYGGVLVFGSGHSQNGGVPNTLRYSINDGQTWTAATGTIGHGIVKSIGVRV